jgi:L-aminopeptidase/D-esterase-like protein
LAEVAARRQVLTSGGDGFAKLAGLNVGHYTDASAGTGCTVLSFDPPAVAGVDVRGSSPGTREIALLAPECSVDRIDALVLCGGSALGLSAASGVADQLRAAGRGHPTPAGPVPIVPAAVVFDLATADPIWPGPDEGAAAFRSAGGGGFECGNVGAGTGVTAGPGSNGTKSGLGAALIERGPLLVGALAAVNPLGTVVDESGVQLAGLRVEGVVAEPERSYQLMDEGLGNTVIAAIVCNADLDKLGATRVARMAHDGMARAVRPTHTASDGDTVFAAACGDRRIRARPDLVGALAADALAAAIRHSVRAAKSAYGIDAAGVGGKAR